MNTLARMPTLALSNRIRELRHAAGISQEKLAHSAGLTIGVVRNLEQGKVDDPQWSTIRALARILGASLDDLAAAHDTPQIQELLPAGRPKKKLRTQTR